MKKATVMKTENIKYYYFLSYNHVSNRYEVLSIERYRKPEVPGYEHKHFYTIESQALVEASIRNKGLKNIEGYKLQEV